MSLSEPNAKHEDVVDGPCRLLVVIVKGLLIR